MSTEVSPTTNLFDYFNEHVESARDARRTAISPDTLLYLVTLLTDRARADRPGPPARTLAEMHALAASAPPAAQARTYRELGDQSLYQLGYFSESLSRRIVGPDYYAEMGAAAYHRVDVLFKALFADAFGPVFRELAVRFRECVQLVGDVRDAHRKDLGEELADLYDAWLATGDEAIARRLRERGMVLPRNALIEG